MKRHRLKKKVNYTDDRGEMPDKLFVVAEDVLPSPAESARALARIFRESQWDRTEKSACLLQGDLVAVSPDGVGPCGANISRLREMFGLEREKVTINLSAGSLTKFRRVAKKHRMPYQALIRVLDRVATRIN